MNTENTNNHAVTIEEFQALAEKIKNDNYTHEEFLLFNMLTQGALIEMTGIVNDVTKKTNEAK